MAFCAWCGNQVTDVSYAACPRCGNPSNGSQRVAGGEGSKGPGIIIGVIVGGLVLVAVVGILAAIAIPNFLTALNRSKQKRTMADMRLLATAVEAYSTNENRYPDPGGLSAALVPKYLKSAPTLDGWETPLRYECVPPTGVCHIYAIGSAGADKTFEFKFLAQYGPDTRTNEFDKDIVFSMGRFVQYPEGVQQ